MYKEITEDNMVFLNCLPIPILILNQDYKVIFANEGAVNLYGYDSEGFKDIYILDLKDGEDDKEVENSVMKYFFNKKKNYRVLSKHKTREGKIIDVDIQTTVLKIKDEIVLLECIREVTEQQNVLKTYERAIDIMSKVVKDLTE